MKEDVQILKPTILLSVPRILNRLVVTIKEKIEKLGWVAKYMI